MTTVLEPTQDTSHVWGGFAGKMYVFITKHEGGTWQLQLLDDDDGWIDISPSPNPFTSTGLWWFDSVPGMQYQLEGGSQGARAKVDTAVRDGVELII